MATVLEPNIDRGPAPASSDGALASYSRRFLQLIGLLAAVAFRIATLVGAGHCRCFRCGGPRSATDFASSQSGLARIWQVAAPNCKSHRDERALLSLCHADRVDHAHARQGFVVAQAAPRSQELLDRSRARHLPMLNR